MSGSLVQQQQQLLEAKKVRAREIGMKLKMKKKEAAIAIERNAKLYMVFRLRCKDDPNLFTFYLCLFRQASR
jgi:hypothetical protein